jgi:pimeloyl-ACP methyl ester carboxylesterase/DNA-binding CsgD family transcriptional regulator
VKQQIRFATSFDGTRIAYSVAGEGPPLVKAPHWMTHLEHELASPVWSAWIEGLARGHALLRLDQRGCGLSDRGVTNLTVDHYVNDLEAVVDAAQLDRFALFGHSQGAALAVEYAARHPDRVSHLALLGGYARGVLKRGLSAAQVDEVYALVKLVEAGWGRDDAVYRRMFATQFLPGANLEVLKAFAEQQRQSATPETAARVIASFFDIDVRDAAPRVRCPTLVLHARGDIRVPFEEGRTLAGLIPGARLVALESDNHVLLDGEPAFANFFEELRAFLPGGALPAAKVGRFAGLTGREAGILELLARGLDNSQIAARLDLSEKTVRNNVSQIFDKIEVENRSQAIVAARDGGFGRG